jgi:hypothetical protein
MIIASILAVAFLAAALAGGLLIVRLGIGREEREGTFATEAPTLITSATRAISGLYVWMPEHGGRDDQVAARIGASQAR